jgi:hypothetical protein
MSFVHRQQTGDDPRPTPPDMQRLIEVRVVQPFGIGDHLLQIGETAMVTQSRADYLRFLRLVA